MKDILIVHDSANALKGLTGELGFYSRYVTCVSAPDGKTALEMLRTAVIDVVITGTTMADMDGRAFVKQVKERHPAVRIFVVTESEDKEANFRPGNQDGEQPVFQQHTLDLTGLTASIMAS